MNMMTRVTLGKLEPEMGKAIHYDGTVMISGERGTGKKLVAHLIHQRSARATAPFVIASRLDFTESVPQAQHGTLLIDGVEELTGPMQLQLLQFLESGRTNGNPRLITTTGADVFESVRSNTLATDLFYRLNIIRLLVPALRERREDIPVLFTHYLSYYAKGNVPGLSDGTVQRLVDYAWPGNVQELKSVAEALAVKDLQRPVEPGDLPEQIHQTPDVKIVGAAID